MMKGSVINKLFYNKYVQKNTFRAEDRTECAWFLIENNYIPKITECYLFLVNCLGIFWERENSIQFSENIKFGSLTKKYDNLS